MKKILLTTLMCVCAIMLSSCSKDDKDDDGYYVKYEAKDSHYYLMKVSVNTENGTQTFSVGGFSFSQTFGPVKKGFSARITASDNTAGGNFRTVSIYVSKGEEPFTLKQTGSTSASYVIDF
jgi:hypothetical protein